ncbi:MAG: peroxiredoxin [Candidatus Caenarcaniphilales bacterium]|nr:peroxiredoxin [Candidatus Caenarcaniphilales bacterium]
MELPIEIVSTLVSQPAPELVDVPALVKNDPQAKISSDDFKGKWILLFSYPLDFTFVCPTEIKELIAKASEFEKLGVQPILISTDSTFSHLAWQKDIGECPYPWIGDTSLEVSESFGILKEDQGIDFRATILIDPEGIVQSVSVNNLPVGRNVDEIIRTVQAFQEAAKGKLLPCNWKPGEAPLN